MNKRRFYASMGWVAMATAVFFCACRPELPKNEEQIPEGMCKVVFRLPKAYPDIPALVPPFGSFTKNTSAMLGSLATQPNLTWS